MPVKKTKKGWKTKSAITGKTFKKNFKTKREAEAAWRTSKRRSQRKRSKDAKRRGKR